MALLKHLRQSVTVFASNSIDFVVVVDLDLMVKLNSISEKAREEHSLLKIMEQQRVILELVFHFEHFCVNPSLLDFFVRASCISVLITRTSMHFQ